MQKKSIIILIIVLAVLGAAFYYLWYVLPPSNEENGEPQTQPPTLFAKDDYKIENRSDGTYIVVEKVGLTAKVPTGWEIKKEGDDYPESEYWVNLNSPDAESESGILVKGCGISVMAGTNEKARKELVEDIENIINVLEANPKNSDKWVDEDYELQIIKFNEYTGLHWLSSEKEFLGQSAGIDIPIDESTLISIDTVFPPEYKEICQPIWEEFLENVSIE